MQGGRFDISVLESSGPRNRILAKTWSSPPREPPKIRSTPPITGRSPLAGSRGAGQILGVYDSGIAGRLAHRARLTPLIRVFLWPPESKTGGGPPAVPAENLHFRRKHSFWQYCRKLPFYPKPSFAPKNLHLRRKTFIFAGKPHFRRKPSFVFPPERGKREGRAAEGGRKSE